jgi:3-methyladenine DNA glycosylase AlkD
VTPEAAIAALQARADPARAADMRAYHKQTRVVLGLSNALTGEMAEVWRKSLDQTGLVALAQGLWASDIFEARIVAGKLLLQARMRPDDAAAWGCIAGFVPDFDSWAIADAVAQSGQKRLMQVSARLDAVAAWVSSDHMWTRRAALVFTLPFTKSRHPSPTEAAARARILGWCETLAPDRDGFIQKAVAWWLRELSRREPATVAAWLATHGPTLKPFARKEAARHLPG